MQTVTHLTPLGSVLTYFTVKSGKLKRLRFSWAGNFNQQDLSCHLSRVVFKYDIIPYLGDSDLDLKEAPGVRNNRCEYFPQKQPHKS